MMNALALKQPSGAAAVGATPSTVSLQLPSSAVEKNKQWQRELLMERIRSHATQQKTFPELSKSMRMSMLEKRYALDSVEKSNLQKCLDSMQHCIKVTSRQGLVERLESLSRQLGLKFMEDTAGLFISTDMFYLEIMLDASGALTDVKVHHECKIEQQSCSELVNCLNRGDFADFTVQLEGLSSIYQLNAEPKVKKKAFVALQAMETDLYNLFQMQNFSKDTQKLLECSAVGLALKRRGGHPMKLTYFVSPYDLISLTDKCLQPLNLDLITSKDIGMSVTVNLEAASANKLQILPTITFVKDAATGIETPVYAPLTQLNSTLLPATFVLRLNKPLPVCAATLRALLPSSAAATTVGAGSTTDSIATTTVATTASVLEQKSSPTASLRESTTPATIMNLIVQTASEQQLKNSAKGLFVCLPDQTHCYFFTDNKQLKATLVSSVPFTEPAQVPIILAFLKKQALFYSLLSSCVRPQAKMGNDMDTTTILEVNAISFQQISVSLQQPYDESMATVEFNLNDSTDINCNIYASNRNYDLLSIKLTKIVQKSLSIPVTLRALLKFWEQERMKIYLRTIGSGGAGNIGGGGGNVGSSSGAANNAYGNFSLAMGPNDPGGGGSGGINSSGIATQLENNATTSAAHRAFLTNTSNAASVAAAAGIASYLKLKTELVKQEDFHESPKSATQTPTLNKMQSVEASSLGKNINQQQQKIQQTADMTTSLATDLEIADKYKNIWKDKTANLKNTVSITPIMQANVTMPQIESSSSLASSTNIEIKRTGIEIIPLIAQNSAVSSSNSNATNTTTTAAGSSTITITPINSNAHSGAVQLSSSKSDKKLNSVSTSSSSSSSSSKRNLVDPSASAATVEQKEKKRNKKKRDDSPMGPPEKVFSRQNSPATITSGDTVARKFSSPSSSPKGSSGGSMLASATASAAASSISSRPSPKHSPVYTSPKHHSTASNSPKSPFGTHSPKHGSSGKPSMSTLKNAAASLSPKAEKTTGGNMLPVSVSGSSVVANLNVSTNAALVRSLTGVGAVAGSASVSNAFVAASAIAASSLSKNRDKDKSSAASITSMVKTNVTGTSTLQPMKSPSAMNHISIGGGLGNTFNTAVGGSSTASSLDAVALRKAAVSGAVSLMTSTTVSAVTAAAAAATHQQHGNTDNLSSDEYRVKQSQEGLKLTINKTSNKNNSSSSSYSNNKAKSSPSSNVSAFLSSAHSPTKKPHTGLKPGVNSGPASKKTSSTCSPTTSPAHATLTTATTQASKNSIGQQNTKHLFQKSYSSGSLSSKLPLITRGGSSSSSSESYRKSSKKSSNDRERERDRSAVSTSASQPATRLDHHGDMLKILQYASPTMAANMEGFMKNLSTKFQIPKLSQRATATTTAAVNTSRATSAPTTPISSATTAPFVNAVTAGTNSVSESVSIFTESNSISAATQPQQVLKNFSEQQILSTAATRPPPPPYHAAIAASAFGAAVAGTVAATSNTLQQYVAKTTATAFKVERNVDAADEEFIAAAATNVFGK